MQKVKEQIDLGFGYLVEQYKNLTFEDEFDLGQDITNVLNVFPNDSDSEITNKVIKDLFLNRLQADINNFVVDKYLVQPPILKPLFGNITANEILKIDINQTILTKTFLNETKLLISILLVMIKAVIK